MKKIVFAIVSVVMLSGVILTDHIHDENCGHHPETDSGCVYEIQFMQEGKYGD